MEIAADFEGERFVLSLKGDLDVYATAGVEQALTDALGRAETIVVDLSGVPFADSSGLSTLIGIYKKAKNAGKELRLRRPTPIVAEILTITRMKKFLPMEES